MTRIIAITITAVTVLLQAVCLAGAVNEPNDNNGIVPETSETVPAIKKPRPKIDIVTMASFYLRDGNAVSGRLLSDDNTQIVIEMPLESTIITKTYSRREMDGRSLRTRPFAAYLYYTQLGEYFAAQTWDFRDDPDEFIQAVRCYEKAKQYLQASGAEPDKLAEIDKAIKKTENDRDVWTREVESRAKLKKLEFEAEAENRLKQLERHVAESITKVNETIKYLDKTAGDMKKNYQQIEKTIGDLNKDFVEQIQNLQAQINDNRAAINELSLRLFLVARPPAGGDK